MTTSQSKRIKEFQELHRSGCFVMANPWDRGTAIFLQNAGFKALATTSAGVSFAMGLPDEIGLLSLPTTLENIKSIVDATSLPVNADFQDGYTDNLEELSSNIEKCIQTGIAGFSIEDATGKKDNPLSLKSLAIEKIRVARSTIDKSGLPVVLTARCEAWLVGDKTPLKTVLERLVAYAEAGADCLYAPGVKDELEIEQIVKAVAPKPVNVLVSSFPPDLSISRLADLGVRRISVGSALARTAWGAFMKASQDILKTGSFREFVHAASFSEINNNFIEKA